LSTGTAALRNPKPLSPEMPSPENLHGFLSLDPANPLNPLSPVRKMNEIRYYITFQLQLVTTNLSWRV